MVCYSGWRQTHCKNVCAGLQRCPPICVPDSRILSHGGSWYRRQARGLGGTVVSAASWIGCCLRVRAGFSGEGFCLVVGFLLVRLVPRGAVGVGPAFVSCGSQRERAGAVLLWDWVGGAGAFARCVLASSLNVWRRPCPMCRWAVPAAGWWWRLWWSLVDGWVFVGGPVAPAPSSCGGCPEAEGQARPEDGSKNQPLVESWCSPPR